MRLLSLDTSYKSGISLALFEDGELVEALVQLPDENMRQNAVTQLIPSVDRIMAEAGWQKESLTHICVGLGPGSFTGVRIGVVTARSLAQALAIPLVGVNIFETIASFLNCNKGRGIILDGGRNHLFVAAYGKGDRIEALLEPRDIKPAEVFDFCSSYPEIDWYSEAKVMEEIENLCQKGVKKLPEIAEIARVQGKLACEQLISSNENRNDLTIDHVKPLYLRGASVTLKKNASKL